jgi:hypothetical protein
MAAWQLWGALPTQSRAQVLAMSTAAEFSPPDGG